MLKLIKYEFRKTMFSRLILLAVTGIAEILYFLGVFSIWEKGTPLGSFILTLCAMFGILYIGVESLLVLHRDLNTKQSYMLFLTPRNSYQVLGAKVLENALSIFIAGMFFLAVFSFDASVALVQIGGLEEWWETVKVLAKNVSINLDYPMEEWIASVLAVLSFWLMNIVTGYLAIVLSATVFAGKRLSGLVSAVLYFLITWGTSWILDKIPYLNNNIMLDRIQMIGWTMLIVLLMYLITGWIMERKLSV